MTDSNAALAWMRAVRDSDLPSTRKLVLLTLGLRMDPDGSNCRPSVSTICSDASLSNRTVIDHLEAADGVWIEREAAGRSGKGWKRNRYVPRTPEGGERGSPRKAEGGEATTPRQRQGGEALSPEAVREVHTTSTKTSTEPYGDGAAGSGEEEQQGLDLRDAVEVVWRHYVERYAERFSERGATLLKLETANRDGHIRQRLRDGFTPEELCRAIDGCFDDPWHRDKGKHDLEYILRNESKALDFLNRAEDNGGPPDERPDGREELAAMEEARDV